MLFEAWDYSLFHGSLTPCVVFLILVIHHVVRYIDALQYLKGTVQCHEQKLYHNRGDTFHHESKWTVADFQSNKTQRPDGRNRGDQEYFSGFNLLGGQMLRNSNLMLLMPF